MGNIINRETWLGRNQLRYVEGLIWWNGVMSRREVIEKFSCSAQQATAIIQSYLELNPNSMHYSLKVRRYLANPDMVCVFEVPCFADELSKEGDLIGQVILPVKVVNPKITRYLMVAIRQNRIISMKYQSRSGSHDGKREIVPHAFGYDGVRYHVRAWCTLRQEYRDFSLLRIQNIHYPEQSVEKELPLDVDWEDWVEVRLRINPNASKSMKEALMEDYSLNSSEDLVIIRCRRAMRKYVLYRMGLDAESELPNTSFFESV